MELTLIAGGGESPDRHTSPRCATLPPHDWCAGSWAEEQCGYAWTDVAGTHRCQLPDGHTTPERHEDGAFWEHEGTWWHPAGDDPKEHWTEEQIRASTRELRSLS